LIQELHPTYGAATPYARWLKCVYSSQSDEIEPAAGDTNFDGGALDDNARVAGVTGPNPDVEANAQVESSSQPEAAPVAKQTPSAKLDVETMRANLESMFTRTDAGADSEPEKGGVNPQDALPVGQPRLTFTRRRRMVVEKALVEKLGDPNSDEAASLLWKHWYGERGSGPRDQLIELENLIGSQDAALIAVAAKRLEVLRIEYKDWAEPINRLAMVRFMQNRHGESAELCEQVIALKPWHFGALSGLAMCWKILGKVEEANKAAAMSLPPPGQFNDKQGRVANPRKNWVARMIREMEMRQKFAL
jgi:hypothetical protein